jgi:hypothetical protein
VINPLALGVTIGGLLLDVVVPRPKPQVGTVEDTLSLSARFRREDSFGQQPGQHERPPIASGASR